MMEELVWAQDGHLRSRNVSTYKIPASDDCPRVFNVHLMETKGNDRGVKGNKTVGEAGVQHAISVWLAASRAVSDPTLEFPASVMNMKKAIDKTFTLK